jgi:uncharacterized protein
MPTTGCMCLLAGPVARGGFAKSLTMHIFRICLIVFVLFVIDHCFAASFDCGKAKGKIEELICEDEELSNLDEVLAKSYKAVLAIIQGQDSFKAEQKEWLTKERNHCKDKDCLKEAYYDRTFALMQTWDELYVSQSVALSKAHASRVNLFEGQWTNCTLYEGDVICSSYTLMQQGERVCGEWEFWGSYHIYNGQVEATLQGENEAKLELICGNHASTTKTDCDYEGETPDGSWEEAKGKLLLCDGRLYSSQETISCGTLSSADRFLYHPLSGENKKRLLEQPWIMKCLKKQ